jgi:sorting nexin-8
MSLFGDDPPSITPTRRPKTSASLFADDDEPASAAATAGGSTAIASSPLSSWTPVPSAKRASMRGAALLRSLVPAGQAPDVYADMYDRIAAESKSTGGGGGGVDAAAVRDVLLQSGVDDEAAAVIRKTVMPDESRELGRGEVNVLLAMIGLAQEGEEVTLDGVDERKRSESPAELSASSFEN